MKNYQTQKFVGTIYHIVEKNQIETIKSKKEYGADKIAEEGFIHFSQYHQVSWVKNKFYKDQEDLFALAIDCEKLKATLKYEGAMHPGESDFPHLYGVLNTDAITEILPISFFAEDGIHPDTQVLIDYYQFDKLPVEGTFYKSTYRSPEETVEGKPMSTAMIGLYSHAPMSASCFHRLPMEEIWHVYAGDPFRLILLHSDGTSEEILMGCNPLAGQRIQFVVPANTWQAGELLQGGRYALFGCTLAPGFTGECFEAGVAEELIKLYPNDEKDIQRLSVNGDKKKMPIGFAL